MAEQFRIDGLKEVMAALDGLKPKLKDSVLRSFFRETATKQIVKPLRSHVSYSNRVTKHIQVKTSRSDKTKNAVYAGPTYSRFWIRWVEKGTKQRYTKTGASRGKIKARNQIEPFVDSRIVKVIDYMNKEMGNSIEKILLKKLKRARKIG